ncbi:hypothetical protein RJ639_005051 [Escallonia herrerae]|uniref:Pentatricopeptide repeat-containing protein n=1 Tax=Escallonia herrerae TaxID=1293975 RepID=A0AA88W8P7_9ASTE|nr:hypothetical protein RJ639_005051 [Escallonia herrerae]
MLGKIALRDLLSSHSVLSALVSTHDDPDVNAHVLSWLLIIYGNLKMTQDAFQSGDVEKAEELLGEMELKGIFPDLFTYNNTLISLYCKKSMHYEALCVQDRMERGGVRPDIVTFNSLIYGVNEFDEALRLREEMERVDSWVLQGKGDGECKELLFDMLDAGCCPSYCTWIVDGYCGQGNEEAVVKLPDEFVQRGLRVDISVYRALIRRFSRREKVDYAQRIFRTMQGRGISGDCVVYTSLAYAYLKAGKEAAASDLLDEMYHKRLMITMKIYRSFIAPYAGDNNILAIFWDLASVKGLFSKTMFKHIQQLKEKGSQMMDRAGNAAQSARDSMQENPSTAPDVAGGYLIGFLRWMAEILSSKLYNYMLGLLGVDGFMKEFWDLVGVMQKKGYGVARGTCVRVTEKFNAEDSNKLVEFMPMVRRLIQPRIFVIGFVR